MIKRLRILLEDPRTEWAVLALILVNAAILGLETSPPVMAAAGPLLHALDSLILAIFVVEIASR
ncbi:MAG TPA: ion transporter, partial [Xanthobacteraceae bacterium]